MSAIPVLKIALRSPSLPAVIKQEIANTPMPSALERAKAALAECINLDQAKDIANEAKAIAQYAMEKKGAEQLLRMARQIQIRAFRRIGQLLKQFKTKLPRAPLAMENVAIRIASMDQGDFERALADDNGSAPFTFIQKYAPKTAPPARFRDHAFSATAPDPQLMVTNQFNSAIGNLLLFARKHSAPEVAQQFRGNAPFSRGLREGVRELQDWLDEFEQHLPRVRK